MKSLLINSIVFKTVSCILLLVCLSSNANSQIDSVNVDITFSLETDPTNLDSLGNYSPMNVMNVNASIYDVDFMGQVVVSVYNHGTDLPVAKLTMTAKQFINTGQKVGSTVTLNLDRIDPTGSYRIETQVRNSQGANFPMVITNYNL